MIKLGETIIFIRSCTLKFDKNGDPYLKCKGFQKELSNQEKEIHKILELNPISKKHISGANYLSSINIYGEVEELEKLEKAFQEEMDNIAKKEQEKGKGIPKIMKVILSDYTFLRNYLINGILVSNIYSFNFVFGKLRKTPKRKEVRKVVVKELKNKDDNKKLKKIIKEAKKIKINFGKNKFDTFD